jgi:hypothetical protein
MGISRQLSDLGVWLANTPLQLLTKSAPLKNSTVAGHARAHRRQKWVPLYGAQVDSGCAQDAQATAQDSSGFTQALLKLC